MSPNKNERIFFFTHPNFRKDFASDLWSPVEQCWLFAPHANSHLQPSRCRSDLTLCHLFWKNAKSNFYSRKEENFSLKHPTSLDDQGSAYGGRLVGEGCTH